jgi:hypothetical protein
MTPDELRAWKKLRWGTPEYRLRKKLQPFIEQDMQVTAELERKLARQMALANERAMRKIIEAKP